MIVLAHVRRIEIEFFAQARAVKQFTEEVQRLGRSAKGDLFVSQAFLLSLGKMINMFCSLDELKKIKASMNNDFSLYKR